MERLEKKHFSSCTATQVGCLDHKETVWLKHPQANEMGAYGGLSAHKESLHHRTMVSSDWQVDNVT
jgi:hypothetical protein